jgi:hypothetical protein
MQTGPELAVLCPWNLIVKIKNKTAVLDSALISRLLKRMFPVGFTNNDRGKRGRSADRQILRLYGRVHRHRFPTAKARHA